jgi:hypothetical protein
MAQLSSVTDKLMSMTPRFDPAQTLGGKLSGWGSWLLLVAALILCGMGGWGIVHRLLHAPVAQVMV